MMFCIYPGSLWRPFAMNQRERESLVEAQFAIRRRRLSLGISLTVVRHITWTVLIFFA